MKREEEFEIKNNDFLRQFEATIDGKSVKLEYSSQPRKIFLTKFIMCDELKKAGADQQFLTQIFDQFVNEGQRVVPTCPQVAKFFKTHKSKYRNLLPTGINI